MTNEVRAEYRDFARLYGSVTEELVRYVNKGLAETRISQPQADWFRWLIEKFAEEFQSWDSAPAPIRHYLDLFNHDVSHRVRLSAHAFLHVAYDLPRIVARTLRRIPRSDRLVYRSLFLRPAPLFRQVFLEQARRGYLGLLARPLGYLKAGEILSYWLLSLRSVAWIQAESLADSAHWEAMEYELARAIDLAGERARGCIEKLDNSTLFQAVSPLLVASQHPGATAAAALGLGGLLVAVLTRARNERVAKRIAYFGACVHIELAKATMTVEGKLPPADDTLVTA
jgi:hypothetical protein